MPIYKRGEIWWAQYTVDGRSFRKSTGQREEKLAQKVYQQLKSSQIVEQENGRFLSDALKLWLLERPRSNSEKSSIKVFLSFFPDRPLSKISGFDIRDALAEKSPSNYNRMMSNVRAAINLAVARNWCKPIVIPKRKTTLSTPRFLTKAEWQKLYLALPTHLKPIAEFAVSTGLRKSNVLNLKWQNVDLIRGVAWVDGIESKSRKPIAVPLSSAALAVLKSQKGKNHDYVFTYRGQHTATIHTTWKKCVRKAGIENFRFHDLRHTWASWHVMNGTPLAVIKELGGWHDVEMVMRYAHLSPDHLTKYADNAAIR